MDKHADFRALQPSWNFLLFSRLDFFRNLAFFLMRGALLVRNGVCINKCALKQVMRCNKTKESLMKPELIGALFYKNIFCSSSA